MKLSNNILIITIIISSILGVLVSSYLLKGYVELSDPIKAEQELLLSKCDSNGIFSCKKIAESEYSHILGIPVPLIGIVGYGLILLFSLAYIMYPKMRKYYIKDILLALNIGGLAFSLSLTAIEAFVLGAFCQYCLVSQALMLISFVAMLIWYKRGESTI